MGKAKSTLVTFDRSRDLNIPVTAIEADDIRGTIAPANLAGDYYISITGNARSADIANTFKGVELSEFVLKDSPKLTGNPIAPTVAVGTLQTDGTFIVPTLSEITGDTGETESITLSELSSILDLRTTTLTSIENPPAFVGQHAVVNKKIYFGISTAKCGSTETDVDAGWTPIN